MSGRRLGTQPRFGRSELPAELRLLLALDRPADLRQLAPTITWEPVVALARRHRCEGLLVNALLREDLLPHSDAVAAAARRALSRARRFRERVLPQVAELVTALSQDGIDAALLKGASLLVAGLHHPVERPLGDLDLLVPEDCWLEAAEHLHRLGYDYRRPQDLEHARQHHYQLPALYHDARPLGVELHRHILTPRHRLRFGEPQLATTSLPLPDGTLARRLDDADELAHLALHFWGDRAAGCGSAVGQLYDIRRRRLGVSNTTLAIAHERATARGYPQVLAACLDLERILLNDPYYTPTTDSPQDEMLLRFALERVLLPRDPALQFLMVSADVDYTPVRAAKRAVSRFGQYRRNRGSTTAPPPPGPWRLVARLLAAGVRQPTDLAAQIRLDRWAQSLR